MDKPIDRTEPIRTLVEKAGGKLIAAYMTTGPHDVVIVTEPADGSDAVAVGMAAAASGAVAEIETVRACPVPVHPRAQSASMLAARISSAYQRCPLTRPLRDSVSSDAPSTHADLLGGGEIHGLVVSQHVECKKKVIDSIARSQATDHVDLAQ